MTYCTVEDLERDPWLLANIPGVRQTDALCLAAVSARGCVLQYVYRQTAAICLAAVQNDGRALRFVKKRTASLCLAAVRNNGSALSYVDDQTPEQCLAAVSNNPLVLRYARCQTAEIATRAVLGHAGALACVKLPFDRLADAQSGQLADWLRVFQACRKANAETTKLIIHPLLENLSFSAENRDDWLQLTPNGRYPLDDLVDLAEELKRLAPRDDQVQRFQYRVHQQVEQCLSASDRRNLGAARARAYDSGATL